MTPIAEGLQITTGMAGQTLTATAFAAIFASLFVSTLTQGINRRTVVLSYSLLLMISCLMTAFSTSLVTMLIARVVLGLALGGFWAMAASVTMQLVAEEDVPKALSVVFGGVSVALVLAAPLGSFLGETIGWRAVFIAAACLGGICFMWQLVVLPSLTSGEKRSPAAAFLVLRRAGVPAAAVAIFASFAGQFAFFTYLRPFLEMESKFDAGLISAVLLLFGIANFAGTSVSSLFLKEKLRPTLGVAPLILTFCALLLVFLGYLQWLTAGVIAVWGLVFGLVPVGWSTWITRNIPDDAESAGGLQVAIIQIANTFGAALGGYLLDTSGPTMPFIASAALLAIAAVTVLVNVRKS